MWKVIQDVKTIDYIQLLFCIPDVNLNFILFSNLCTVNKYLKILATFKNAFTLSTLTSILVILQYLSRSLPFESF